MASFFTIPDTNQIVYEGDVVQLSEYPNVNFIAGYGWYEYKGDNYKGWYFVSVTNSSIVPVSEVNLSLLTVVSSSHQSSVVPILPPMPFPPGPCPPRPFPPGPFPDFNKAILDRTFITVETIAQRNSLNDSMLINGRICRVNHDAAGNLAYYQWNGETLTWDDLQISNNVLENTSLAHDIGIQDKILKIPVYGSEDINLDLSRFGTLTYANLDPNTHIITLKAANYGAPDTVFTIDCKSLIDVYEGRSTDTIKVNVNHTNNTINAEAIIDPRNNNALVVTPNGLYVDISKKANKLTSFTQDDILVASADGDLSDSGIQINKSLIMGVSDKKVPTEAAINFTIDQKVDEAIEGSISDLVDEKIKEALTLDSVTDLDGNIVIYTEEGMKKSKYSVGKDKLSKPTDDTLVATEAAVLDAMSWKTIS